MNGTDKEFLLALKHREITLQHYEIGARTGGDKETEVKVQRLLVALRNNITAIEMEGDRDEVSG